MGDGFAIDGARRRTWTLDHDDGAVGRPPERAGGAGSTANDDAEDDTYTMWLPPGDGDPCTNSDYRHHDFDRCVIDPNPGGLSARLRPSTLFLREPKDVEEMLAVV
jgi:hypothetical protein